MVFIVFIWYLMIVVIVSDMAAVALHDTTAGTESPSGSPSSAGSTAVRVKREKIKPRAPILPPCRVCGEKASGLHYGVNSCEACKVSLECNTSWATKCWLKQKSAPRRRIVGCELLSSFRNLLPIKEQLYLLPSSLSNKLQFNCGIKFLLVNAQSAWRRKSWNPKNIADELWWSSHTEPLTLLCLWE